MPIDPVTPEEWQDAVDSAYGLLGIDAARKYGLVVGGPTVIVSRCEEILAKGAELGFSPSSDATERLVGELISDDGA